MHKKKRNAHKVDADPEEDEDLYTVSNDELDDQIDDLTAAVYAGGDSAAFGELMDLIDKKNER